MMGIDTMIQQGQEVSMASSFRLRPIMKHGVQYCRDLDALWLGRRGACRRQADVIVMPAHQPHALAARTAFKMLLTMIRSA
jgi:hypothetical protein